MEVQDQTPNGTFGGISFGFFFFIELDLKVDLVNRAHTCIQFQLFGLLGTVGRMVTVMLL